jgi:hypothetical protein
MDAESLDRPIRQSITESLELVEAPWIAVDRLYDRYPDAQSWIIRIGHRAMFRIGSQEFEEVRTMFGVVSDSCEKSTIVVGVPCSKR